jgi:hypothetical protein
MTTQMIRKQIYIQRRQDILLKRISKVRGVSEAEVIRQAIEREISGTVSQPLLADRQAWEQVLAFLESRKSLGSGEAYQWNRQDAYEERESRWIRDGKPE